MIYQRQIGYKEVRRRGRMTNNNGNATLFFASLFSALAPNYTLYQGGALTTVYFWHISLAIGMMYFTGKSYSSPTHGRHGKYLFLKFTNFL